MFKDMGEGGLKPRRSGRETALEKEMIKKEVVKEREDAESKVPY